jgi:low temperature requirement protein LtrA
MTIPIPKTISEITISFSSLIISIFFSNDIFFKKFNNYLPPFLMIISILYLSHSLFLLIHQHRKNTF